MARPNASLVGRTLVQIDRAFWCIHEHPGAMLVLGLPTFLVLALVTVTFIGVWRTWEFSPGINFILIAFVVPLVGLFIFTVVPLPCAVFAWRRAGGEVPTAGECFTWCGRRSGRLFSVVVRLILLWLPSLVLFGLPLLVVWPRTSMTPLVALFENERRMFRRSRRILREDVALYVIGGIYLAILLVLGGMVWLPRLLLGTDALGAHLMEAEWRHAIVEQLWIFEALCVATVLTALAMSWWISLTLLYHDVRWRREGEDLRQRIVRLRQTVAAGIGG